MNWKWLKQMLGIGAVQGDCVPRAMFNAMAWSIAHKTPVFIADVKGHWQAVGLVNGELEFLEGNGWVVQPGPKEGTHPIYKVRSLRDATNHFIRHNPWCMPLPSEQKAIDRKIKEFFGTDPEEVE